MNDIHSLAHSKWNCKYHIVFAPKYRRQVFFWRKEERDRGNPTRIVQMEGSKYSRSRNLYRPCTYVGRDTAQNGSVKFHGIFKGEKLIDDI